MEARSPRSCGGATAVIRQSGAKWSSGQATSGVRWPRGSHCRGATEPSCASTTSLSSRRSVVFSVPMQLTGEDPSSPNPEQRGGMSRSFVIVTRSTDASPSAERRPAAVRAAPATASGKARIVHRPGCRWHAASPWYVEHAGERLHRQPRLLARGLARYNARSPPVAADVLATPAPPEFAK